jgi:hypothetical protein
MHRSMLRKFLRDHYLKQHPRFIPTHPKDHVLTCITPPHVRHTTHNPRPLPHQQTTDAGKP